MRKWLNSPTPGSPRTRDGKPDLAAAVPRAVDGTPDLSGVWHVQSTSLAEMKRLYGDRVRETNVPGMEADTISKYSIKIVVDFRPAESPIRPEAAEILKPAPAGNQSCRSLSAHRHPRRRSGVGAERECSVA